MRFEGTLRKWNDERGFGFIEPTQGGQEIFVHIKAFPAGTGRPVVGLALSFEVEMGPQGKKRAKSVQFMPQATRRVPRHIEAPASWTAPRLLVVPAFLALCWHIHAQWGFKPVIAVLYLVASVIAIMVYAFDKSASIADRWRTPELTLHLISLVGGWPGALLAQQLLRHKTAKGSFVTEFWLTVGMNVAALVLLHRFL